MLCTNSISVTLDRHSMGQNTRTPVQHPAGVCLRPSVHARQRELPFVLVQELGFLRTVRKQEYRRDSDQDGRNALDDEQHPPRRDRNVRMLDAEGEHAAKCTCNGSEASICRQSEPDLLSGVEQRCQCISEWLSSCTAEVCMPETYTSRTVSLGSKLTRIRLKRYERPGAPAC